jgi:hypothetical protein
MKGTKRVQIQNPNPHSWRWRRDQGAKPKSQKRYLFEKYEKLDNAFDDVPCHIAKIMTHT